MFFWFLYNKINIITSNIEKPATALYFNSLFLYAASWYILSISFLSCKSDKEIISESEEQEKKKNTNLEARLAKLEELILKK